MTTNSSKVEVSSVTWHYSKGDEWLEYGKEISNTIEQKLQTEIANRTRGIFTIKLSSFASKYKYCKGYEIRITLDALQHKTSNNTIHPPIIIKAIQRPTNQKYQKLPKYIKNIQRIPDLDTPLPPNFDEYKCKYDWQFKSRGSKWINYDEQASKQIELAYIRKNQPWVILTLGEFRSPANRNVYRIIFYRHSVPIECEQQNSNDTQLITEIRCLNINQEIENAVIKNSIYDLHILFKQFYRPLGMQFWMQKKMMRDALICNICFTEFQDQNFLEYHVSQKIFKNNTNTNNNQSNVREENKDNDSDEDEEIVVHDERGHINPDIIAIQLSKCIGNHYFHAGCIVQWLEMKKKCAVCQKRYGYQTGTQPPGTMKTRILRDITSHVAGYEKYGRIEISFDFPSGIQGPHHPNPGVRYAGDFRKVYLPFTVEGMQILEMTKIAFLRRLVFSVGRSITLQLDNRIVWSDIHFKTSPYGGTENHGWPDDTYFSRVRDEFSDKGIAVDDIPTLEGK